MVWLIFHFFFKFRKRVEEPDLVMGIHPGLHADGIYEFWEPTLELLLDKNIVTVFTVLNQEEYHQSLAQLDALFCKYLYKGLNPFASNHVKQTPHNADLMWASNMYLIIFKVSIDNLFDCYFFFSNFRNATQLGQLYFRNRKTEIRV